MERSRLSSSTFVKFLLHNVFLVCLFKSFKIISLGGFYHLHFKLALFYACMLGTTKRVKSKVNLILIVLIGLP